MKYKTKSIIIGRKKSGDNPEVRPCFIALFDMNDPHKKNEVPAKIIDYDKIHKVVIKGLNINYLLPGNDLVINDLEFIHIKEDPNKPHLTITGEQNK